MNGNGNGQSAIQKLDLAIRGGNTLIAIKTPEDARVLQQIEDLCAARDKLLVTWSVSQGLRMAGITSYDEAAGETPLVVVQEEYDMLTRQPNGYKIIIDGQLRSPDEFGLPDPLLEETIGADAALKAVEQLSSDYAFLSVFYWDKVWFGDPMVRDALRRLHATLAETQKVVVLLGPVMEIPAELEKLVKVIEWPMPTTDELMGLVAQVADLVSMPAEQGGYGLPVDIAGREKALAEVLSGLTYDEADAALVELVELRGSFVADTETFHILNEHRKRAVEANPALTYWATKGQKGSAKGLDLLQRYTQQLSYAFRPDAPSRISIPPGMLLIGPPGTGKTQSAKAIAAELGYDLLVLDMAQVFASSGGLVGQSEAALFSAMKVIEAITSGGQGLVLLMDEVEKGTGSGGLDGGTTDRVLGSLLTWVNETARGKVFIIASANRADIDPAFISRLNMVMVVDLPGADAREDILRYHVGKRLAEGELDTSAIDFAALAAASVGYSGRELELAVEGSLQKQWQDECEAACEPGVLEQRHLLEALHEQTPVSRIKGNEIAAMRRWITDGRAKPASSEPSDWEPELDKFGAGSRKAAGPNKLSKI